MELPNYVKLNECELRLRGNEYWRDAGCWGVGFKIKNGKLLSSYWRKGHDKLHGIELIPISEEEWRNGNKGYIDHL